MPIDVTDKGIAISINDEQFMKTSEPIEDSKEWSSKTICFREVQLLKAQL